MTSDLKLYDGKIWFGSDATILSDGTNFSGFGAIDSLTGALTQPLKIGYGGAVRDFILTDTELTIAGNFDSVNNRPVRNFAVFHLNVVDRTELCNGGNVSFTSSIGSGPYQWQMDTGSGYANISNNINFSGTNSATLQLVNAPSAWYGYRLRCQVNTANSEVYQLRFTNTWTGAAGTAWENPANWSCGSVPDANTDVIINGGTVTVNSNTVIRTLFIASANMTIAPGVVFTVLH